MINSIGIGFERKHTHRFFKSLDTNNSGFIDFKEFERYILQ